MRHWVQRAAALLRSRSRSSRDACAPPEVPSGAVADRSAVFARIHEVNHWGDAESRSGPGSTLAATRAVRAALPPLWHRLGARTVLDAPCGDYNWFRAIPRESGPLYVGGDIVPALVAENQRRYGDERTRFTVLDITVDPLPDADFWLCRDCLFHLSERDVFAALRNFVRSRITYLCATIHPDCPANRDIASGGFRAFNLELPPYGLGKAQVSIDEGHLENHLARRLGLWTREAVALALEASGRA